MQWKRHMSLWYSWWRGSGILCMRSRFRRNTLRTRGHGSLRGQPSTTRHGVSQSNLQYGERRISILCQWFAMCDGCFAESLLLRMRSILYGQTLRVGRSTAHEGAFHCHRYPIPYWPNGSESSNNLPSRISDKRNRQGDCLSDKSGRNATGWRLLGRIGWERQREQKLKWDWYDNWRCCSNCCRLRGRPCDNKNETETSKWHGTNHVRDSASIGRWWWQQWFGSIWFLWRKLGWAYDHCWSLLEAVSIDEFAEALCKAISIGREWPCPTTNNVFCTTAIDRWRDFLIWKDYNKQSGNIVSWSVSKKQGHTVWDRDSWLGTNRSARAHRLCHRTCCTRTKKHQIMRHSLFTYMYRILLISYLESSLPLINIKTNSLMEYDVIVFTGWRSNKIIICYYDAYRSNNIFYEVLQSLVREPAIINFVCPSRWCKNNGNNINIAIFSTTHHTYRKEATTVLCYQ